MGLSQPTDEVMKDEAHPYPGAKGPGATLRGTRNFRSTREMKIWSGPRRSPVPPNPTRDRLVI
jgi:hypothetical protein